MANPQLRLRRGGPRNNAETRRPGEGRVAGFAIGRRSVPGAEHIERHLVNGGMLAIPDGNPRGHGRPDRLLVKRPDIADGHRGERQLCADR